MNHLDVFSNLATFTTLKGLATILVRKAWNARFRVNLSLSVLLPDTSRLLSTVHSLNRFSIIIINLVCKTHYNVWEMTPNFSQKWNDNDREPALIISCKVVVQVSSILMEEKVIVYINMSFWIYRELFNTA